MRVMTFNIWNYTPPWPLRRDLIAQIIREQQPDIVGLQETRHDFRFQQGEGQGEQLGRLTGYHATFRPAQVYLPFPRVDEGLTLLTRVAPTEVMVRRLSRLPSERADETNRIVLGARLVVDEIEWHVFDTHFSLGSKARQRNAAEAWAFVSQQAGEAPAVLLGDLNAEPQSPEIALLTAPARLQDVWAAAHPHEAGNSYPAWAPRERIDYILARRVSVQGVQRLGAGAQDAVYPSDHLGLVAALEPEA